MRHFTIIAANFSISTGSMLHGSGTCLVRKESEVPLQRAEMRMVRWMCEVEEKD